MAEAGSQLRSRGEWTLRALRRGDGGPRGARSPVVAPRGAGLVRPGRERRERGRGGPPREPEMIRMDRPRAGRGGGRSHRWRQGGLPLRRREERASSLAGVLDPALLEVQLEEVEPEGSTEAEEPERLFLGGAVAGFVGGRLLSAPEGAPRGRYGAPRGGPGGARFAGAGGMAEVTRLPRSETAAESFPCKPATQKLLRSITQAWRSGPCRQRVGPTPTPTESAAISEPRVFSSHVGRSLRASAAQSPSFPVCAPAARTRPPVPPLSSPALHCEFGRKRGGPRGGWK